MQATETVPTGELAEMAAEIRGHAKSYGLDFFEVIFELPEAPEGSVFRITKEVVEGLEPVRRSVKRRKTG